MRRYALLAAAAAGVLAPALSHCQIKTTVYATGFSLPIAMIQDPTDANRQFVIQQRGLVRCVINGVVQATPALDLTGTVSNSGSEKGLLGMAFDPNYATNRIVYFSYTTGNTSTVTVSWIAKGQRNLLNPNVFDTAIDPIFTLNKPFQNHNGGTLKFGPDGYLYYGMGDGGSGGDPGDRAQNLTNLHGKMLRIDPSSDAYPGDPNKDYAIPPGQPFSGPWGTLAPEIWALGLRNPWKWSFDDWTKLGTGGLLVADVGQDNWEEVNYAPLGNQARNYGWRRKEGYAIFTTTSGPNTLYRDPIWVYSHSTGISITGGHVYRGLSMADLFGRYFFADYGAADLWSLKLTLDPGTGEASNVSAADVTDHTLDLSHTPNSISSIDADSNGELYLVDYGNGRILRMEAEDRAWPIDVSTKIAYMLGGQVRSLSASDGKELSYAADFSADTIDGDAGVLIAGFRQNRATVSTVNVLVRARTNQPAGHSANIRLRNWATGRLDSIHSMNLTTAAQNFQSTAVAAANYVRASDQRIEVAITGNAGFNFIDPVATMVDHIRVGVN